MELYNKIHKTREIAEKHLNKIKLRGGKGIIAQISKNEYVVNYSFEQKKRKEIYNFFNTQFDVSKAYKLLSKQEMFERINENKLSKAIIDAMPFGVLFYI